MTRLVSRRSPQWVPDAAVKDCTDCRSLYIPVYRYHFILTMMMDDG
jgi:hypothetical protein